MSDIPVCIDISHHQGYPDFDEVRACGVLGMIHKATEGSTFIDDACGEPCECVGVLTKLKITCCSWVGWAKGLDNQSALTSEHWLESENPSLVRRGRIRRAGTQFSWAS